jgi:hypothetical protein
VPPPIDCVTPVNKLGNTDEFIPDTPTAEPPATDIIPVPAVTGTLVSTTIPPAPPPPPNTPPSGDCVPPAPPPPPEITIISTTPSSVISIVPEESNQTDL